MRLNQFIAHAGICSRRKADQLVERGLVQVNGVLAQHPAIQIKPTDHVTYQGKILVTEPKVYLLLYKPFNCITTLHDPQGRTTYQHYLPPKLPRVYPVGRLDRNTTGVLLITNDGYLARALAHPSKRIEKTYEVTLKKNLSLADLRKIRRGIRLEDGVTDIDSIVPLNKTHTQFRLRLHSGKNRIIRRIFQSLSHQILSLKRISLGSITLDNLSLGSWRYLKTSEVNALFKKVL